MKRRKFHRVKPYRRRGKWVRGHMRCMPNRH